MHLLGSRQRVLPEAVARVQPSRAAILYAQALVRLPSDMSHGRHVGATVHSYTRLSQHSLESGSIAVMQSTRYGIPTPGSTPGSDFFPRTWCSACRATGCEPKHASAVERLRVRIAQSFSPPTYLVPGNGRLRGNQHQLMVPQSQVTKTCLLAGTAPVCREKGLILESNQESDSISRGLHDRYATRLQGMLDSGEYKRCTVAPTFPRDWGTMSWCWFPLSLPFPRNQGRSEEKNNCARRDSNTQPFDGTCVFWAHNLWQGRHCTSVQGKKV